MFTGSPFSMLFKIVPWPVPNGWIPRVRKLKKTHPAENTSLLKLVNCPPVEIISGAIHNRVPLTPLMFERFSCELIFLLRPKSEILIRPLIEMRIFSGLMLQWIMFCEWM